MTSMRFCWSSLAPCALAVVVMLATGRASAQEVDPAYRFRTIRTTHFAIHFHQESAPVAAELVEIAEATWQRFNTRPSTPPPALTHVVVVDQSESSNGFASMLPRNTIVLYAAPPTAAGLLNPSDWLRTLFVHEFTHIVHLDRAEGWAGVAQRLFGRAAWTFPNTMLPLWQIEGLATFKESASTASSPAGRLHWGAFRALTTEAVRAGEAEPLDRVGGGLVDWPGGLAPYAYGLSFHTWLAQRYGPESLETLSDATARSLPWLGTLAFKGVYDEGLGRLWDEYQAEMEELGAPVAADAGPAPRQLTRHGFQVSGPRYLPRTCSDCPTEIAYALRTPHERPGLHIVRAGTLETRRLTTRFFGDTVAATQERVFFDQQERRRNAGIYSDLYVLDRATDRVTRLTRDQRLMDPDLSPDGDMLVAVQHGRPGQRDLVLMSVPSGDRGTSGVTLTRLASEPGTRFNTPRWSPDGRRIVASRQRPAGPPSLVIVDLATRQIDVVAADSGMHWATPTWRPDGQAVVAGAARGDDTYDLYEVGLSSGTLRRLTHHAGGASWPDISADGHTLVYVGYAAGGSDLYEIPYAATADIAASRVATTAPDTPRQAETPSATASPSGMTYRPWSTLLPTSWTPTVRTSREQIRLGAAISGQDVLGYHAWSVTADWPALTRVDVDMAGLPVDWSAWYIYGRWRPQVWAAVSRRTSLYGGDAGVAGSAVASSLIEHTTELGVQIPIRRLRFSQSVQASIVRAIDTLTMTSTEAERNRSGARIAWRHSSAQFPGYAISPERGLTFGTAAEIVTPELGASGRGGTATADMRVYIPGPWRHHVVALRTAGGYTWGDDAVGRLFGLGGGEASPSPGTLGSDTAQLLRGFPSDAFIGRQIATMNVDYRFPIARPQRGLGAWPFFLRALHGAVVADAGHTWSRDFDADDLKVSIGAEVAADLVLGYGWPLTLSAGVARGRDGSGSEPAQTTVWGRVGYAF
jgi:hypothetical protein